MKKLFLLAASVMVLAFSACSDDDNNSGSKRVFDDTTAPSVVSITPSAGAVELDTFTNVVITYDEPIERAPNVTIQVSTDGGASYEYIDSAVVAEDNTLTLPIKAEPATEYTITILKPSIRDASYNFAEDYKFTFSTKVYNMFDAESFDIADTPVNPNATPETVKLYQYLKSQFGKATLSGAIANVNWNTQNAEEMYRITGKYPAINCFDFIHHIYSAPLNPSNWINYTNTQVVEDWANNGGIVACMWHWNVPRSQDQENNYSTYTVRPEETDFTARNATRSARWEYTHAMRDIDIIADYLLALQDKGIPVIWRPLHEARGNYGKWDGTGAAWFWWGTSGPAQFKKLWIQMYDRFKEKGVNNVIWVWTSDGLGEVGESDANWYPGDEYVDIIARDYYWKADRADYFHTSLVDEFQALYDITGGKKIIALAEGDALPSVRNMLKDGAFWSWTMPWYGSDDEGNAYFNSIYNSAEFLTDFFNSEYVITRDEVPSFK